MKKRCGGICAEGSSRARGGALTVETLPRAPNDRTRSADTEPSVAMFEAEAGAPVPEEARPNERTVQVLRDIANRLRIHSIRTTCTGSSG